MALNFLAPALVQVHPSWLNVLNQPDVAVLLNQIDQRLTLMQDKIIYPPQPNIFQALKLTCPATTKVVILGQDPYPGAGQAMGLSFSVPDGIAPPPSLRNIYIELANDLGVPPPNNGNLTPWAQQGVLLLNSVLTVEQNQPGSHSKLGWQAISDALIDAINHTNPGCVFLLWGQWAYNKAQRIDSSRHYILRSTHPSPLSAYRGFFGCRHFSQVNAWLTKRGDRPIEWAL